MRKKVIKWVVIVYLLVSIFMLAYTLLWWNSCFLSLKNYREPFSTQFIDSREHLIINMNLSMDALEIFAIYILSGILVCGIVLYNNKKIDKEQQT